MRTDTLCQEVPKWQGDGIPQRLIARTVARLAQFALTVAPLADVRPVVWESLQPLAFHRREAAHNHSGSDGVLQIQTLPYAFFCLQRPVDLAPLGEIAAINTADH